MASKGKRERKRKRKEPEPPGHMPVTAPAPDILRYIDVGFATVSRRLQETTARKEPLAAGSSGAKMSEVIERPPCMRRYAVVFVARSGQPSALNGHFPQMVGAASEASPSLPPIRLVGLSKSCEGRLSEAVGIPRVSCIGLAENAPNSKALIDFVRGRVPVVDIAWLKGLPNGDYKPTKINASETTVGQRKSRKPEMVEGEVRGA